MVSDVHTQPHRQPFTAQPHTASQAQAQGRQQGELAWLLTGLIQRVPHTTSALLLSSDGLVKAAHGFDPDSADHMAALASGLYSLARSTGARFAPGDKVLQVAVELESSFLFVSAAGTGACLAVLAGRDADVGVLSYEMGMLVKSVRPYLSTPARQQTPAGGR
ncbi:roadblock/LC7 domain-containing protein [Streptomyces natalensis]|uniref:Dynein regulation protein LC7 n=1 Tax=Streptomyces natalensis ATCC 27448 TaxID=1240678 RepID=A0A0D7CGT5_9ACTN|nr:roadblock/LC7 domain-containing protein [Streptomyces natalensis]KIZ15085.1 dynein regulation protein LC7 [Streptomyces natalensis ATCC 27448]